MMKDGAASCKRKLIHFLQESWEIIAAVIQTLITLIYLVSRVGKITIQDLTAIAVVRQNGRLLEKCLEWGANVHKVGTNPDLSPYAKDGWTLLHAAASLNNKEAVYFLWEKGADLNKHTRRPYGATALHLAVAKGNEEIMRFLIESGIDIDACDGRGNTALAWAQELTSMCLLIELGADFSIKNKEDQFVLDPKDATLPLLRQALIKRYKMLLEASQEPESLKYQAAKTLFNHLRGEAELLQGEDVPVDVWTIYRETPIREQIKKSNSNRVAFCEAYLELSEEEKVLLRK